MLSLTNKLLFCYERVNLLLEKNPDCQIQSFLLQSTTLSLTSGGPVYAGPVYSVSLRPTDVNHHFLYDYDSNDANALFNTVHMFLNANLILNIYFHDKTFFMQT